MGNAPKETVEAGGVETVEYDVLQGNCCYGGRWYGIGERFSAPLGDPVAARYEEARLVQRVLTDPAEIGRDKAARALQNQELKRGVILNYADALAKVDSQQK